MEHSGAGELNKYMSVDIENNFKNEVHFGTYGWYREIADIEE